MVRGINGCGLASLGYPKKKRPDGFLEIFRGKGAGKGRWGGAK